MRYFSRLSFIGLSCFLVALVGGFVAGGCGSSSNGSSSSSGSGTFRVALVDAPPSTGSVSALNITIERVEANVNGTWTPITTVPQSFNLLDLVRNEAILGSVQLPAGHYTQVRLFPSAATLTDATGTQSVTIPSAVQTGVKVNVDYDIGPNQITTVLLDFNVGKSLIRQGNGQYRLQPVIPAVVKVLSGTVTGTLTDGSATPLPGAAVTATYMAGDKYALGTEVNTGATLSDGTFKVWALLPGTYTVTASYTDPVSGTTKTATTTGVIVSANQNTALGTLLAQ